ncbi:MAG: hypothetical protein LAO03_10230 [Acidobacteriia bacterium]|nr:hypothetical protein [Terriglobia bacterium]
MAQQIDRASAFLRSQFRRAYALKSDELLADAQKEGISRGAMFAAKKELGIRAEPFAGSWWWLKNTTAEDGIEMLAEIAEFEHEAAAFFGTNPSPRQQEIWKAKQLKKHPDIAGLVRIAKRETYDRRRSYERRKNRWM